MRPGGLLAIASTISSTALSQSPLPTFVRFRAPHRNHSILSHAFNHTPSGQSSGPSRSRQNRRISYGGSNALMSLEAVVCNRESLEKKSAAIRSVGPSKLQVIADFDGTLTKYTVDGRRGQTSHGLLQQGNTEYDAKRQALYDYYHPLEYSPTIPLEEKTKLMEEWWEKTHGLLVEGGLTFDAIKKSVADATIAFRDGLVELFEFLEDLKTKKMIGSGHEKDGLFYLDLPGKEKDVPVLIFSAGLADIIEEVFRQKLHRSFRNIKVVSNRMVFDDNGRLISFKGKTIHVLNKNEHALDMAAPVHDNLGDPNGSVNDYTLVKNRANVLLLGDHIGDLGMSDGVEYENRISVGFLNDNTQESIESYREAFDVVYLNDASMWGVIELASQLCSSDQ